MKKTVDERQELELMKIERAGFWVLFFALTADILLKVLFFQIPVRELIGEHIAFFAGCITIIAGCTKRGLWTYYSVPCLRDYLVHSLAATVIFTILFAAAIWQESRWPLPYLSFCSCSECWPPWENTQKENRRNWMTPMETIRVRRYRNGF